MAIENAKLLVPTTNWSSTADLILLTRPEHSVIEKMADSPLPLVLFVVAITLGGRRLFCR